MQYRDQGFSRNLMIANTQKVERSSVIEVFKRADDLKLTYEDIKELSDNEVYRKFFTERHQPELLYTLSDYEKIHKELQGVGVTLKLLWQEYVDRCKDTNGIAVGYT